jgi:hypothetical protein
VINPMIVDKNYNIWYRDFIPLAVFDQNSRIERKDIPGIQAGEFTYRRTLPVLESEYAKTNLGKWAEVKKKADAIINPYRQIKNSAAYPIVFDDYSTIQIYITAVDESEMDESVLREKTGSLLKILASTSIVVDLVQVGVLDLKGRLVCFCLIKRSMLENYNPENIGEIRFMQNR